MRGRSVLQGWDIGITDPARVRRLPAGTDYFKNLKGVAVAQMASRRTGEYATLVSKYGELRPRIQHRVVVHEVSGGMGKKASRLLLEVFDIAKELKVSINYREEGAKHTWTANDFAIKWVQRMPYVHGCEVACNDCACRSSKGGGSCRLVPQDSKCEKAGGSGRTVSQMAQDSF